MPASTDAGTLALIQRVEYRIERLVNDGECPPHSRLASERELAQSLRVKRHIVRRAIDSLTQKGRLYRLERSGTFVQGAEDGQSGSATPARLKGVTFIEHNWPYVPEWLQGMVLEGYSRVLEQHSLRVRFTLEPKGPEEHERLLLPTLDSGSQGCVLGNVLNPALMEWLGRSGVPYVVRMYTTYDYDMLPPHHSVCVNRGAGGFQATQHLLQLGHRRIGFLGWLPTQHRKQLTFKTYQAALAVAGIEENPAYAINVTGLTADEAVAPALQLLCLDRRPTAIVAHNDFVAMGVYRAASQLGLRIPEDLSVVGYDDHPEAARCAPGLTTFQNKVDDLATACLELLLDVASGRVKGWQHRVIEAPFVLRGSTGRPPGETG